MLPELRTNIFGQMFLSAFSNGLMRRIKIESRLVLVNKYIFLQKKNAKVKNVNTLNISDESESTQMIVKTLPF